MATIADINKSSQSESRPVVEGQAPVTSVRYDAGMLVFALWFFIGLFLDGAAHNREEVDSFFTPWHLVLYTGFAACAGWITFGWARNLRKGYSAINAIPRGYKMSVIGVIIFALGGVFDFWWHSTFGIEVAFEALVSPAHLILATGLFLIMNGPFRAAWWRDDPKSNTLLSHMTMLLSLTFTFSILTFFTMSLNPLGHHVPGWNFINERPGYSRNLMSESAYAMFLLQSVIMVSCLLVAMRRWRLPFGAVTMYLFINTTALAFIANEYIWLPMPIIAGLVADTIIGLTKPSLTNPLPMRAVAFAVPSTYYLVYFIILNATQGVWWSVHLWTGAVVMAGIVGVLLSYMLVPSPALANNEQ
jgi:hypothetical protein